MLQRHSAATIAHSSEFERALTVLVIMLAPIAPHFASQLWAGIVTASGRLDRHQGEIDWSKSVLEQTWPQVDPTYKVPFVCFVSNTNFNLC